MTSPSRRKRRTIPWSIPWASKGLLGLFTGLALAAPLAVAGETPAPRRMTSANWTQHRKLGAAPAKSESAAEGRKLVWRSLQESPAAHVSDGAVAKARETATDELETPAKPRRSAATQPAGGATRLRVQVQPSGKRAHQAKAARSSGVVRVAHEGSDDEPVLQLAQQDAFDPFGGTQNEAPAETPAPTPDEPLGDQLPEDNDPLAPSATEPATTEPAAAEPPLMEEPAAETPAAETPAPAPQIDEPPAQQPYAPDLDNLSPQPPEESQDEFPTNNLPGDLCANGKYGCRQALDILQDDTLRKVGPGIALSGAEGVNFPCVCPLGDEQYAGRSWSQTCFEWKASAVCHKPLYFEEVGLERYGHAVVLQPVVSAAQFFVRVPLLPYEMGMRPPWECVYPLGHYRPGSCAPYYIPPVPVSLRGGLLEAGVVTGLVYIIP